MQIEWGSIADWVSGIGSLSAALAALYIARTNRRIKLRGYAGHRPIIGPGHPLVDVFAVSATNVSQRPTVITNIGFTFGVWRWKQQGVVTFMQDQYSNGIPKPLGDGETGSWNVPLGEENQWFKDLATTFSASRWSVWTWRVRVYTSNGGYTTFRPDKNTRTMVSVAAGLQVAANNSSKRTREKPRAT